MSISIRLGHVQNSTVKSLLYVTNLAQLRYSCQTSSGTTTQNKHIAYNKCRKKYTMNYAVTYIQDTESGIQQSISSKAME